MVITRTYRPSDAEAIKILNQIKAKLGISGRVGTLEERRKAYYYLKGKGWNMSMLACNPDAYPGNAEKKALCMLFNEMRGYQMQETEKGNREQLKKYGSAFKSTYERNKRIIDVQKRAVESAFKKSGMAQVMGRKPVPKIIPVGVKPVIKEKLERNTGVKSVPKPKPVPTIIATRVPTNPEPHTVHVTSVQEPKKIDLKKVGLGLLGLAILYYFMRRG